MLEDLKNWRGRLLLHVVDALAPVTIGDLAVRAEVDESLASEQARQYCKDRFLHARGTRYDFNLEKRARVEQWLQTQFVQLQRGGRLLFVPGMAPADKALLGRTCYLCKARADGQDGTLWMGRTASISAAGATDVNVTIRFPTVGNLTVSLRCPALAVGAAVQLESRPAPPTPGPAVPASGTNVPEAWPQTASDMVDSMIRAINDEIPLVREDEIRIHAGRGVFEGTSGTSYVYRFAIDGFDKDGEARPALPDDTPIQIQIQATRYKGVLVGQTPGELLIALDDDLGRGTIGSAVIISSPADLLEGLKTSLRNAQREGRPTAMGLAVFNRQSARVERLSTVPVPIKELNPEQQEAVRLALGSQVAFIWGPPGTGKTYTLGYIIQGLRRQGKRVLLLSHTNVAVDTLLLAGLARMQRTNDFVEGRILRYGVPYRPELKAVEGALPEKVAERRNPELSARRRELEREKDRLDRKLAAEKTRPAQERSEKDVRELEAQTRRIAEQILAIRRNLTEQGELLVAQAQVVACTLTKAYMSQLLSTQTFDAVVIDEASMAPLPAVWLVAAYAKRQMILTGDFRQLSPIAKADTLAAQDWLRRDIFAAAGIQQAVDRGWPEPRLVTLCEQRRMHPAIALAPNKHIYGNRLRNFHEASHFDDIVNRRPFPGVPVGMVDTRNLMPWNCFTEAGSRFNVHSALLCVRLAGQAVADGVPSVGIITPFAAQARLLRRVIRDADWPPNRVTAATVHRFQGAEQDLIIFDAVVDQPSINLGRLLDGDQDSQASRLVNVAWTRARAKFLFVGKVAHLKAAMSSQHGLSPFFWEARTAGDQDASMELADELIAPGSYPALFAKDLAGARKATIHTPVLSDELARDLLRLSRRGADVTLVVGDYSPRLDELEQARVRVGFDDNCSFLAWLNEETVWFGRGAADGNGCYFRQSWPAVARDLWNLTAMDRLLQEGATPTKRIAERISWRGGPRCERCGEKMRVRFGQNGFYWMCPCQARPSKQRVNEAAVSLAAAEVGVSCPQHGRTMIVTGRGTMMVCRVCGKRQYLGR